MRLQRASCHMYCGCALLAWLLIPSSASAGRAFSIGFTASNPRGDFATGWSEGVGFETGLRWDYWKSIDASVGLSFLDHQPKVDGDPEVLLGVWTLGVHWTPSVGGPFHLDVLFGAQHHTALFHTGWDKYVGNKGYNESDLGACFGIALDRCLSDRWSLRLGVRTNTIFTEPEWVRYETVSVGLVRGVPSTKRERATFSTGDLPPHPYLALMSTVQREPVHRESLPFAVAQPLTAALDFNPLMERHSFNPADGVVGFRGIFPQVSAPYRVRWHHLPVRLPAPLPQTPFALPLTSRKTRELIMAPDPELRMSPSLAGLKARELAITLGDEAGDAMMGEFSSPEHSVGNRGSLLGLDLTAADAIGQKASWWMRGGYRKDDWLAHRRHAVRTPIAPVEEGRENVGADEGATISGGIRWAPREDLCAEWDVAAKHNPALWVRDRMTLRTTKWRGESAVVLARTDITPGTRRTWCDIGWVSSRTENAHTIPAKDVRFASDALSVAATSFIRPVPRFLSVRVDVAGFVERMKLSALGDRPSHGYDGPPSRTMWKVHTRSRLRPGEHWITVSLGAEMWEDRSAVSGAHLEWKRRFTSRGGFQDGGGIRVRAGCSSRIPSLFQQHGWSAVEHPDAPPEGIRFSGGDLDAEKLDYAEAAIDLRRWSLDRHGYSCGLISVALTVYHERVRDFITAANEEWYRLGSDLEWVRSGHWANGGTVTSTGADLSLGTETWRGGFRAYIYLRDVQWKADRADVARPTLGGKWGAGMLAHVRLPKKTEILLRLRSADPPRFASYGGWTEATGTDRLRCDAALETELGNRWHATITALDILDDGHIEVPGGNAVGFRVAGELRYSWIDHHRDPSQNP